MPTGEATSITEALPRDLLRKILKGLSNSYRFVAPVCRKFRDHVDDRAVVAAKRKYTTYHYSISSEAALQIYLDEAEYYLTRKCQGLLMRHNILPEPKRHILSEPKRHILLKRKRGG
eukprot:CAMPEP_0194307002 /NCGR_PEP_ID=MMETSP0171-20130528/3921_1 /TAXON_ID=218684 /ORGANISM="Corethron pennatum, Strain L29A3" /LENGTH=116 /DNA_ID=CAMNT_0039058873 /DNA_START=11 /DNA_END=361 /DNA_ORIENTATION=+